MASTTLIDHASELPAQSGGEPPRHEDLYAKRKQIYADMGMMLHNEGGLICPMFNDFVDATSERIAGWKEGVAGYALMNSYAPLRMWVAG